MKYVAVDENGYPNGGYHVPISEDELRNFLNHAPGFIQIPDAKYREWSLLLDPPNALKLEDCLRAWVRKITVEQIFDSFMSMRKDGIFLCRSEDNPVGMDGPGELSAAAIRMLAELLVKRAMRGDPNEIGNLLPESQH